MKHNSWPILFACLLVAALSAAGCARGIATGGGTIPGANPDTEVKGATKANFGFWGDSCGAETAGNFNYHDRSVSDSLLADKKGGGLKIIGRVGDLCSCTAPAGSGEECDDSDLCLDCWALVAVGVWECFVGGGEEECLDLFPGSMAAIEGDYYSTNPKYVDEGEIFACVVDNGEGSQADPDLLYVKLESDVAGPYDGYTNGGPVSGNIQTYPCLD